MIVVYSVGAVIVCVALLSFIVTKAFEHKAEIVINKPKEIVFEYLKSLRNQDHWKVYEKDENVKQTFVGTDGMVGFIETWEGNKKAGKGSQEIKKIINGERVDIEFRFEKPLKLTNDIYFTTTTVDGNKTKVVWCVSGKAPRPFNLIFPMMKASILKEFDRSLIRLKSILEQ